MNKKFRRAFIRSPLKMDILYVDGDYVFKARTLNISEGGLLLENLPHIPSINAVPMMVELPQFPEFSRLGAEKLLALELAQIERDIFRQRAKLVRRFNDESEVEQVFVEKIGCEFVEPNPLNRALISTYVQNFAKNIIYLLGLFESLDSHEKNLELLRKTAELLGYKKDEKLMLLRQKVLHDYQSLESN